MNEEAIGLKIYPDIHTLCDSGVNFHFIRAHEQIQTALLSHTSNTLTGMHSAHNTIVYYVHKAMHILQTCLMFDACVRIYV